jgi:hypothetical protein
MAKSKSVVSVHVDIAALTWATRRLHSVEDWGAWGKSFVEALATGKPELNIYAAALIQNVIDFRASEVERVSKLQELRKLPVSSVEPPITEITDRKNSKTRETSKKEENEHPWFSDSKFQEAWKDWEKSRKEKAGQFQLKSLLKLSGSDMGAAIQILEQSTGNGYKGLFALKGNNGTSRGLPPSHTRRIGLTKVGEYEENLSL